MAELISLRLAGWKSIREAKIELRPLNVLLGANGAGKSNLVGFFKMLNEMMGQRFQVHVGTAGGAESLLHYGSKRTPGIEAEFRFTTDSGPGSYSFRLVPAAGNTLIFDEERLALDLQGCRIARAKRGHRESDLSGLYDFDDPRIAHDRCGEFIRGYLTRARVFHFHDTSLLGPMRRDSPLDANRFLLPDASNLPAMLYLHRQRYPTAYRRIVAAVRAVAPFFEADDVLAVNLRDGGSTFERLDPERLKEWLEEYALSELWERNVIGGGPY
jgi:predicted ATPase